MSKKVLTPEQAEIKAMKKARASDNWLSFVSLVLAVALVFTVVSIGKSQGAKNVVSVGGEITENSNQEQGDNTQTPTPDAQQNQNNDTQSAENEVSTGGDVVENVNQEQNNNTQTQTPENQQNQSNDTQVQETPQDEVDENKISDDPSQWSKEQIVYIYKQAATKSHDTAESSQTMTMPVMNVNDGDGALGFFISMVRPVINTVLEKQATTYGGITGGYKNLVASDVVMNVLPSFSIVPSVNTSSVSTYGYSGSLLPPAVISTDAPTNNESKSSTFSFQNTASLSEVIPSSSNVKSQVPSAIAVKST